MNATRGAIQEHLVEAAQHYAAAFFRHYQRQNADLSRCPFKPGTHEYYQWRRLEVQVGEQQLSGLIVPTPATEHTK